VHASARKASTAGVSRTGQSWRPIRATVSASSVTALSGCSIEPCPAVEAFLAEACTALGLEYGPEAYRQVIDKIGSLSRLTGATLRNTLNPTVLKAGYKVNVVPQVATADVDGRFLPRYEDEFFAEVDSLLGPSVEREFIHHDIALETTFDGDLCDAMTAALVAEDPGARVVPYCDAKSFSRLGMRCFGFAPLRLPADLDFSGMFHGVDERVPVSALQFGTRVLDGFLDRC
jgi:acetylornithine deacetylase/succinyl-diaminopimelate desuccinylase-like protein